jgi:hypothetical protein
MKKFALIICAIMLLMSVNPVVAQGGPHTPTGERLELFSTNITEYPADTAFFIAEYWSLFNATYPLGKFDFKLEVDNEFVDETFLIHQVIQMEDGSKIIITAWVFNFPEGMEGTHTFVGYSYCPCAFALDFGLVDECSNLNATIEDSTYEAEITFIAP